jgi:anti-sigma B factor antagonist
VDTNLEQAGDVAVLELLTDTLDVNNAADLKAALTGVTADHRKVLLDLGRVRFIDSSGCGAIIAALPKARAAGSDLKLCHLTPQVRTLFELVRMQRIVELFDTRAAALAAFGG